MYDWSFYKGNLAWLPASTILLTRHGSHAYGLNTPESDLDLKGVAIPPAPYFHGFAHAFEQAECKDPDAVIFDVRKFFKLASDCNPNIIEVLFTDESDYLQITYPGKLLIQNRDLFLSRVAKHRFSGYAHAQLKRINTHYAWLKNPPAKQPTRADFDLPNETLIPREQLMALQATIQKQIDQWGGDILQGQEESTKIAITGRVAAYLAEMQISKDDQYLSAARTIGMDTNAIHLLQRERAYVNAKNQWDNYQTWKTNRNPKRAALEEKYGFDSKHGMHLVRLMRMCREILTQGKVIVKRPDREELLAIRNGEWSYEQLVEWAGKQDAELEELMKTSPLPKTADREKLDVLCQQIVEERL